MESVGERIAAIVVIVLAIGVVGLSGYLHGRNTEVAIESIAVLPFVNQNHDSDSEYLSDGLTESIINSLTQLPNLKVSIASLKRRQPWRLRFLEARLLR